MLHNKEDVCVAYFGNKPIKDLHATGEFSLDLKKGSKWDLIAVIEELPDFDDSLVRNFKRNVIEHSNNYWGPSYFFDDEEAFGYYRYTTEGRRKGITRNFFIDKIS
jgi:hypothetical protein